MTILVNEIFHSIQGESTYAGLHCVFIRLCGCNLRCSYCDTKYAYDDGHPYKITDLIKIVDSYGCNLVEITGGEPLLQEKTPQLVSKLLEKSYEVIMETNGSLDISLIDRRCKMIVDVKCPSSNEKKTTDFDNFKKLFNHDQVKFVICDYKDYEYAKKVSDTMIGKISKKNILFSPAYNILDPAKLSKWIIKDKLDVRLQLQLHKIIWPDKEKGV